MWIKKINRYFLVSIGAVPGVLLRFLLQNDFLVNILGAAILGVLFALPLRNRYQILLGVGFCGSLTTFSSWMIKCISLMVKAYFSEAILLLLTTVLFGLVAFASGFFCTKYFNSLMLPRLRFLVHRYWDRWHF